VIELHSRRVYLVGSTPHPDEAFMLQIARHLADAADGVLAGPRSLICDRDRKSSAAVRQLEVSLRTGGPGNSGRKTVAPCVATDGGGR
jgi:hypothetical protein